jgi:peptidoglycan/LPS O-acetylase OafA/YrhL
MSAEHLRTQGLDFLRLMAAGSVVAFHFTYGNHSLGFNPVAYPTVLTAVTKYGFLGVQMFFLISGIVIMNSASSGSARRFATSRMVRLYPAYWASVTVTYVVVNLGGTRHIPVSDYLINMTMLEGFLVHPLVDAVYWTLQVELIFYGVVWLVLLTGQMKRITVVLWAWLGVAALTTAVQVAGHDVPNRMVVATGYAAYFVVGATVALYRRGDRGRPVVSLLVSSCLLSLVRAGYDARAARAMYHAVNVAVAVAVVAASMVLVINVAFGRLSRFGRPWMVTAGLLTYPLYLLHDEVSNVLFTRDHALNRWVLLTVVLAVVVVASWGVHVLVEAPLAPRLRTALEPGRIRRPGTDRRLASPADTVGPIGTVLAVSVGPVPPLVVPVPRLVVPPPLIGLLPPLVGVPPPLIGPPPPG